MVNPLGLTLGIFLLIGVGVVARRLGLLRFEDRVALNNIIIFICLPALIFSAAREAPLEASLLWVSAISLGISIVTLLIGDTEFDNPKTLAAFALGLVLFVVTLALNVLALHIVRKYRERYE